MPPVLVFSINPVSGNFIAFMVDHNSNGAMLDTGINRMRKQFLDLLRKRRSRNIPVLRFSSQHHIADASAHGISFISMRHQAADNMPHMLGKFHFSV